MTVTRGTSNTAVRGSAAARRARKNYLLDTYAADRELVLWTNPFGQPEATPFLPGGGASIVTSFSGQPPERVERCVRCYRCGDLLTYETMEVDRIVPGCKKTRRWPKGGTYARENIRPVCERCNKITGNIAKAEKAAKRKHRNALARVARAKRKGTL